MERTKETLKELIRAGRAKVPAHKVIKGRTTGKCNVKRDLSCRCCSI